VGRWTNVVLEIMDFRICSAPDDGSVLLIRSKISSGGRENFLWDIDDVKGKNDFVGLKRRETHFSG
jgi:hypothetical protein